MGMNELFLPWGGAHEEAGNGAKDKVKKSRKLEYGMKEWERLGITTKVRISSDSSEYGRVFEMFIRLLITHHGTPQ